MKYINFGLFCALKFVTTLYIIVQTISRNYFFWSPTRVSSSFKNVTWNSLHPFRITSRKFRYIMHIVKDLVNSSQWRTKPFVTPRLPRSISAHISQMKGRDVLQKSSIGGSACSASIKQSSPLRANTWFLAHSVTGRPENHVHWELLPPLLKISPPTQKYLAEESDFFYGGVGEETFWILFEFAFFISENIYYIVTNVINTIIVLKKKKKKTSPCMSRRASKKT